MGNEVEVVYAKKMAFINEKVNGRRSNENNAWKTLNLYPRLSSLTSSSDMSRQTLTQLNAPSTGSGGGTNFGSR